MNGRERIFTLLEGGTPDHLPLMPITMMMAADLVGVKYRRYATEAPRLVAGQLAIAETFGFDYVSAISDPAVEASDWGAGVAYFDDQPPAVDESSSLLEEKSRLPSLRAPKPEQGPRMSNRLEAVRLLKEQAGSERAVEGWVEGPCAEAADLRGINRLMMDFFDDPEFVRDLFAAVSELAVDFSRAQVEAGADLIGVGDAAASLIGPDLYNDYVYPFEKRLVDEIRAAGARVRLHICGDITPILEPVGTLGVDILDLDSMVDVREARAKTGAGQILLGNIDPVRILQQGSPEDVRARLQVCQRAAGRGYIAGAGCEIPRGTPHDNILAMREFARNTKPAG